ncbi:MAG: T9SS type A sorting domain-containing protein [Candidatus Eisenbacteria bacterium]|uniref:T9SS type A sorting domain-containing protein n=1 Tax=Eiseniibacteriota bacterium TaxID=2212470 RepID=A0A849SH09_UNCEI|nr:T9SS type A sorting domain-containing protein [Candidatus Eisenbacteria bacterium]
MPRSRLLRLFLISLCTFAVVATPKRGAANDVDGAGDCVRSGLDFGDAPEGFDAYPGTLGRFPTCLSSVITPGGQELLGCGPFSTVPGASSGYVRHALSPSGIWLGCTSGIDRGIDIEIDAKTSLGSPNSFCAPLSVDCQQLAFGSAFGQDECYGDNDAGLVGPVSFVACGTSQVTYRLNNCGGPRPMFLNVLIDFNHDGDWNDAELCQPSGTCAPEWALKNRPFVAGPGCAQRVSPTFIVGTSVGAAWMRITISDQAVPDDYPWAGTANMAGGELAAGETEDYPVHIVTSSNCPPYIDYGDAPEGQPAYSNGIVGHFPTCLFPTGAGTLDVSAGCPANSTVPGTTGFVRHVSTANNPDQFWLGCPVPGGNPADGVDAENNGKVNNLGGGTPSDCDPAVITDCTATLPTINFGQDECYGDDDAGVAQAFTFDACQLGAVNFEAYSCAQHDQIVYVNVLVDWNQDGDWNDNLQCSTGPCAAEWAIKNAQQLLAPGCNNVGMTPIRVGPLAGEGWLRITLTRQPVPDDFPWNGSVGVPGQTFDGGETEDYPFVVDTQIGDPGPYNDRGDAPEGFLRYPTGIGSEGNYPTCTLAAPPSTQTMAGGCLPLSTPPGPAGYVNHFHPGPPAIAAWLGCGNPGVDSEPDGKTNVSSLSGQISSCDQTTLVDCIDNTIPVGYGADECPGDGDAGISSPFTFPRCKPTSFTYQASNASAGAIEMYLNVLVDWTDDGDWNDVDNCAYQGGCAPEWAVKNHPITLAPGCNTLATPSFRAGRGLPTPGSGGRPTWMRVTITFQPVTDDFPWAGSELLPGNSFQGGETEDYVFYQDAEETPCLDYYQDFGDAPENLTAYPNGVIGKFPTCDISGLASTQTFPAGCPPSSTSPFASGYVIHLNQLSFPPFWLGCSAPPAFAVDTELRAKVNLTGASLPSACPSATGTSTDCQALLPPLTFGQDECYGDLDAGLSITHVFPGCGTSTFNYKAELCADQQFNAYLNVLVDWNHDGDWNDVERCSPSQPCAPEWAVKNHIVVLSPGCGLYTTPSIQSGGPDGPAWMRVTLSPTPASDDFPWAGTQFSALGFFDGGETEDYLVTTQGSPVDVQTIAIHELQFSPALPNPAAGLTTTRFALPRAGAVRLSVFDAAGRLVRTLVNETRSAGEHVVTWDYRDGGGARLAAGVYLMHLQFEGSVMTQRVVHLP